MTKRVIFGWGLMVLLLGQAAFGQEPQNQEDLPRTRQELLLEQRREKAEELEPYQVSEWEARIRSWEQARFPLNIFIKGYKGIRPVVGGMPSGSGLVGGVGYVHGLDSEYFQFQTNARYSTRGYTTLDAQALFPNPQVGRRWEIRLDAGYRDLTSLRFFGLGNDSLEGDRTRYFLQDKSFGGALWLNPRGLLSFGFESGFLEVETGPGEEERSVEERFDPASVPGFGRPTTDYSVVGGWVEFDVRNKWADPPVGVVLRVGSRRYDDQELNEFDFTRVYGDLKAYIPLGYRSRILALRLRTSHSSADGGDHVPFHLMETLGGAKTIRGHQEFRFRDTRNLLFQAEYRWEVWTYVDFTFFFDAGKVFSNEDDFNFSHMHTGYGLGLRAHTPEGFVLRFDLARSREGVKFHISGGPSF